MQAASEIYEFGPYRLSVAERVLWRNGQIVPLSPKCFDTLLVLAQSGGSVVEKERLIRAVWPDSFVEEGNLAQNVFTLRKTLGELPEGGQYIQTIPKRGYRLVVPPSNAVAPPATAPRRRLPLAFAAGILAALALVVARWGWSAGERSAPTPRFTRLTVPNNVAYGMISPDGKHIAYVTHDPEGQSLWVRETAGVDAGKRLVAPVPGQFWGVSYTPDGGYLYYAFEDEMHPVGGALFRVPAGGGEPQKLMEGAGAPAFSPDGLSILFTRVANDRTYLFKASSLGTDVKMIHQSDASYAFHNFHWAADGKNIYYMEGTREVTGNVWSLWDLPATGGPASLVLAPQPKPLRSVNWLNRSEIVAVIPDEDSGLAQIWRLRVDGSSRRFAQAQRVSNDIVNYWFFSLTSDARTLLANSIETHDGIWTASAPGNIQTEPARMALPAGSYNDPVWTPDGHVVFAADSNLWLATADGSERKPLLQEKAVALEPAVSPGGSIVFVLYRHGSRNLWRIGLDGSGLRQVTSGLFDWRPALSPDGKWVAYVSYVPGQHAIWKAPFDGAGSPMKLVDPGGSDLAISPDNAWIAYRDDLGDIQIRSFEDGSLLRKIPRPGAVSSLQWSPGGKALTYVSHADRTWQFWSQPIAGGPPVSVGAPLPNDVAAVDWSRDRSRIVYLRREIKVDLALITNIR